VTVVRTTVFKSNNIQAVCIALPESAKKIDIVALGNVRMISPIGESWNQWFEAEGVSDDFRMQREQPMEQVRESL